MHRIRTFLAVTTILAIAPLEASGQTGASLSATTDPFYRHRPLVQGDSIAIFRAVRSRQLAFERFRRENFPDARPRARVDCDDVIGRFCYNHSEELPDRGPEPEVVSKARDALIAAMDTASAWQPGDRWIAMQRVRYLVEKGDYEGALEVVEQCNLVDTWQCYALAGYVQHHAQQYDAAEAFFDQALETMDEATRCQWTNLGQVLPPEIDEDYAGSDCETRKASNRRIWWLADPLYLTPGNERRTEHFSRQVLNMILERAESGYGIWETDLGALITRYGWPAQWENVMIGRNRNWREQAIVSLHPPSARNFIPNSKVYADPTAIRWFEWPLDAPEARSRYAPAYATTFDYLEKHQVVPFRRADSTLVVAAYRWAWDGMPDSLAIEWATVLTANDSTAPAIKVGRSSDTRVVTIMAGGIEPAVLSLEAVAPSETRAARVRFGVAPPDIPENGVAISEILLFEPTTPLPQILSDVAPLALTSNVVSPGARLGLYWEIYGLAGQADSLTTSVSVVRGGRSFINRLARGIGLGDHDAAVTINWTEPTGADAFAVPHSVALELGDLEPGEYTVRVESVSSGGHRVIVEQPIEVADPD